MNTSTAASPIVACYKKTKLYKMKIRLLTLLISLPIIAISCKKNDDATNSNGFAGSYRGTVVDTINSSYWATLNDYAIVIVSTNTPGQVSLTNNLIITNTGTISGNTFTIPQTVATQTASMKVVEWANGVFTGTNNNTWRVTFIKTKLIQQQMLI